MKKLLLYLLLLPFAASAQTVIDVKYRGGGSGGVADGNNYTTDFTSSGATLSIIRNGLPSVVKALDTTYGGLSTVKGTLYRLDSFRATLGNISAMLPHKFVGIDLLSTRNNVDSFVARIDTAAIAAKDYTNKTFYAYKKDYVINGVVCGVIDCKLDGTCDTTKYYDPSGGTPAPGSGGGIPLHIKNNIANRLLFSYMGRSDTLDAAANLNYVNGLFGVGTANPANTLDVVGTFGVSGAAAFSNAINQTRASQSSTAETQQTWKINDAQESAGLYNISSVNGRYAFGLWANNMTSASNNAFRFTALVGPGKDSVGGSDLFTFRGANSTTGLPSGTLTDVVNRGIFSVGNSSGDYFFKLLANRVTQAERFRIVPAATDPTWPMTGEFNINNTANALKYYHNNVFKTIITDNGAGNVGIGTASPGARLGVDGNIVVTGQAPFIALQGTQNGTNDTYLQHDPTTTILSLVSGASTGSFRVLTGGINERMRITQTGNIGIGTSAPVSLLNLMEAGATPYSKAPGEMLQIKRGVTNAPGTEPTSIVIGNNSNAFRIGVGGTSDRFHIQDGTGSEVFTILNGGNVGIGNSVPAYKFDVSGKARITDSLRLGYLPASQGLALDALNRVVSTPIITNNNQLTNGAGYLTTEVDGSTTNEIQTLSVTGNALTISDGNTVNLPTDGMWQTSTAILSSGATSASFFCRATNNGESGNIQMDIAVKSSDNNSSGHYSVRIDYIRFANGTWGTPTVTNIGTTTGSLTGYTVTANTNSGCLQVVINGATGAKAQAKYLVNANTL